MFNPQQVFLLWGHYPSHDLAVKPRLRPLLQDRDRKIRTLKQELKLAPLERKELDERLADAVKKLEAMKLKAKEIEVERKKLENDAGNPRYLLTDSHVGYRFIDQSQVAPRPAQVSDTR